MGEGLSGNYLALQNVSRLIHQHNALDRMVIGTDMPSGTGVVPLGMLRTITAVTTFSDIEPEQAVAMASGNTAKVYGLNRGIIAEGYEADFLLVDAPVGSVAETALEALAIGDLPGIGMVHTPYYLSHSQGSDLWEMKWLVF